MDIGEKIRIARKAAGLTQKELAAKLGINAVNISQLETGQRVPALDTVQRIADALGLDIRDLINIDRPVHQPGTGIDIVYDNPLIPNNYNVIREQNKASIMNALDQMNGQGQQIALKIITDLAKVPVLQRHEGRQPLPEDSDTPEEETPPTGQPGPADGETGSMNEH